MTIINKDNSLEKQISSGVIVYMPTLEGPRFLLLYYGHNYWTFPRGKIEKEEKSFAAALRETKEETGLARADLKFFDNFKTQENWIFMRNGKKVHRVIIFYLAQTQKGNIKISDEHLGFGWFTFREAQKIFQGEKHGENRKVIKQAYNFIESKNKKEELKTVHENQSSLNQNNHFSK